MIDGLIAIPTGEIGRWTDFNAAVDALERPTGLNIVTRRAPGASPAENRNWLISQAQSLGASWIWFLDDDTTFPPDALIRLLKHLEDPSVEAVVPLSVKRKPPFEPIWFARKTPDYAPIMSEPPVPNGHLVPLDASTFGGMLVRLSAIAKLEPPYVALGQIENPAKWNDDLYFCWKLKQAGVQLWGDPRVRLGHLGVFEVFPYWDDAAQQWLFVVGRAGKPYFACPYAVAAAVPPNDLS